MSKVNQDDRVGFWTVSILLLLSTSIVAPEELDGVIVIVTVFAGVRLLALVMEA